METNRVFLIVISKGNDFRIERVRGVDMIKLVAACENSPVKLTVIKCLGRI